MKSATGGGIMPLFAIILIFYFLEVSTILYLLTQIRAFIFQKKLLYLLQSKPFKNDEKCFLFHLKSYFRSRDVLKF